MLQYCTSELPEKRVGSGRNLRGVLMEAELWMRTSEPEGKQEIRRKKSDNGAWGQ